MAIKGSLREASLADVVQLLSLGAKTGCLSVTDRTRLGQIYFERGRITYARIVNRRDRLGDLLVRDGVLQAAELEPVLAAQAADPDARLGELLLARGLISREALDRYIAIQIEEAVFHLFTWSRGAFFFEAGERPDPGEATVSINPEGLLLEAARRVDEWGLIEKKIPGLDVIFEVDRTRIEASQVALTDEQSALLPFVDGTRTVHELVDVTGLTEFETGKALFGLIQAGFARNVGRRTDAAAATDSDVEERRSLASAFMRAGMLEDATREYNRLLELSPEDFGARFNIALIALRERRYAEGVDGFKRLLERHGPNYAAFLNLAAGLRALGRNADALLVVDAADSLRPGAPEPPLIRAVDRLAARRITEARRHFEEHRRRLPEDRLPGVPYYYYASLAAALAADLGEAESYVREGLRVHPRAAPLLLLAGLIEERRGELDGAERLFRRAIEADPALAQGFKNLGDLAYRRGAWDEALPFYQRAAELAPGLGDDVYVKLGNLHYKARNREGAIRHWSRALEINPENHVVRNNLDIVAHAAR
jgi:tetratricopeptide (TPR) repeat protein